MTVGRTSDPGPPGLSVAGVSVRYGSALALDEFSLDVADGEVVAVIGPSGSGKSTLLRAIAGLEPLVAGSISAGGRPLDGVPTHRRDLGLMFQDHALFPHLSVAENIAFGLKMQRRRNAGGRSAGGRSAGGRGAGGRGEGGASTDDRSGRVAELLDLVGLAEMGSRAITELSGGEAQRVALARALAPEPRLLMLDEPFGSLDRVLRDQLTGEVRRLLSELDQTALHVTHDQAEAFALADRVAVLADGKLVQLGAPAELWHSPRTAFVAEFVGHPNIWSVMVYADGAVSWGSQPLGIRLPSTPTGERELVVPIMAITDDPAGPLEVVVLGSEFHDGRHRVTARVDAPARPELIIETTRSVVPGERLNLAIDVERVHLLDT